MNYENKHRIESLAKAACPNNKKVSVIFRSKENKLSDRPNAFIVTVGRIKVRAIAQAKRAMRDLGIRRALLAVNSMRTSDILDIITVELD